MAKNFKLHLAHHFDYTRHVQKVFFETANHSANSDAWFAKKTDRKFRWEVIRKWCAKFENAPWYQTYGTYNLGSKRDNLKITFQYPFYYQVRMSTT